MGEAIRSAGRSGASWSGARRVTLGGLLAAVLCWPVLLLSGDSVALPQYTARASRTCDNCHSEPTGWENPPFPERICTLSCSGCHVDPAGGGLRTVSGFYYGTQTLPSFGADRRPWADREGSLFGAVPGRDWRDRFDSPAPQTRSPEPQAMPTSQPTAQPTSQPMSQPAAQAVQDSGSRWTEPDIRDWSYLAWGSPAGPPAAQAYSQARYAGLEADPLFRVGGDFRYAALKREEGWTFFPMQFDVTLALHPVEHLTLYVEGAAWGGQSGAGTQINGEDVNLWGLHEAFVMTHEWPLNSYVKAGRFLPQFGWRIDDHTAFVRRNLGFDLSRPTAWVSGVELGFNANYPYLNVAAFRLDAGQYDFWTDAGTGVSANTGYRDLWWGLGGSFYWSDGNRERRTMAGLNWYLNPWRWWSDVPLTYLGEVDWVGLDPAGASGELTGAVDQLAALHELGWVPFKGVNVRLRYGFFDPDVTVSNDHQHRLDQQIDLFPYRHTEIQLVVREHFSPRSATSLDFLTIWRLWL